MVQVTSVWDFGIPLEETVDQSKNSPRASKHIERLPSEWDFGIPSGAAVVRCNNIPSTPKHTSGHFSHSKSVKLECFVDHTRKTEENTTKLPNNTICQPRQQREKTGERFSHAKNHTHKSKSSEHAGVSRQQREKSGARISHKNYSHKSRSSESEERVPRQKREKSEKRISHKIFFHNSRSSESEKSVPLQPKEDKAIMAEFPPKGLNKKLDLNACIPKVSNSLLILNPYFKEIIRLKAEKQLKRSEICINLQNSYDDAALKKGRLRSGQTDPDSDSYSLKFPVRRHVPQQEVIPQREVFPERRLSYLPVQDLSTEWKFLPGRRYFFSTARKYSSDRRLIPKRRHSPERRQSPERRHSHLPQQEVIPQREVSPKRRLSSQRELSTDRKVLPERKLSTKRRLSSQRMLSTERKLLSERKLSSQRRSSPERTLSPQRKLSTEWKFSPERRYSFSIERRHSSDRRFTPKGRHSPEERDTPKRRLLLAQKNSPERRHSPLASQCLKEKRTETGSDSFFFKDLKNKPSLNTEVAKLSGVSDSIQNKLKISLPNSASLTSNAEKTTNKIIKSEIAAMQTCPHDVKNSPNLPECRLNTKSGNSFIVTRSQFENQCIFSRPKPGESYLKESLLQSQNYRGQASPNSDNHPRKRVPLQSGNLGREQSLRCKRPPLHLTQAVQTEIELREPKTSSHHSSTSTKFQLEKPSHGSEDQTRPQDNLKHMKHSNKFFEYAKSLPQKPLRPSERISIKRSYNHFEPSELPLEQSHSRCSSYLRYGIADAKSHSRDSPYNCKSPDESKIKTLFKKDFQQIKPSLTSLQNPLRSGESSAFRVCTLACDASRVLGESPPPQSEECINVLKYIQDPLKNTQRKHDAKDSAHASEVVYLAHEYETNNAIKLRHSPRKSRDNSNARVRSAKIDSVKHSLEPATDGVASTKYQNLQHFRRQSENNDTSTSTTVWDRSTSKISSEDEIQHVVLEQHQFRAETNSPKKPELISNANRTRACHSYTENEDHWSNIVKSTSPQGRTRRSEPHRTDSQVRHEVRSAPTLPPPSNEPNHIDSVHGRHRYNAKITSEYKSEKPKSTRRMRQHIRLRSGDSSPSKFKRCDRSVECILVENDSYEGSIDHSSQSGTDSLTRHSTKRSETNYTKARNDPLEFDRQRSRIQAQYSPVEHNYSKLTYPQLEVCQRCNPRSRDNSPQKCYPSAVNSCRPEHQPENSGKYFHLDISDSTSIRTPSWTKIFDRYNFQPKCTQTEGKYYQKEASCQVYNRNVGDDEAYKNDLLMLKQALNRVLKRPTKFRYRTASETAINTRRPRNLPFSRSSMSIRQQAGAQSAEHCGCCKCRARYKPRIILPPKPQELCYPEKHYRGRCSVENLASSSFIQRERLRRAFKPCYKERIVESSCCERPVKRTVEPYCKVKPVKRIVEPCCNEKPLERGVDSCCSDKPLYRDFVPCCNEKLVDTAVKTCFLERSFERPIEKTKNCTCEICTSKKVKAVKPTLKPQPCCNPAYLPPLVDNNFLKRNKFFDKRHTTLNSTSCILVKSECPRSLKSQVRETSKRCSCIRDCPHKKPVIDSCRRKPIEKYTCCSDTPSKISYPTEDKCTTKSEPNSLVSCCSTTNSEPIVPRWLSTTDKQSCSSTPEIRRSCGSIPERKRNCVSEPCSNTGVQESFGSISERKHSCGSIPEQKQSCGSVPEENIYKSLTYTKITGECKPSQTPEASCCSTTNSEAFVINSSTLDLDKSAQTRKEGIDQNAQDSVKWSKEASLAIIIDSSDDECIPKNIETEKCDEKPPPTCEAPESVESIQNQSCTAPKESHQCVCSYAPKKAENCKKCCGTELRITPLPKLFAVENLKRELICTFPTTSPCNPCFKTFTKAGCGCGYGCNTKAAGPCKTFAGEGPGCKKQAPLTCLPSLDNRPQGGSCPPATQDEPPPQYCFQAGCCSNIDCYPGEEFKACCTIDPVEALNRIQNKKTLPQCQEKCIIEDLLFPECEAKRSKSCCCCNGIWTSTACCSRCSSNSDGGGGGKCCKQYSNCCCPASGKICCCCCTYPAQAFGENYWQQQVAINNLGAYPCAKRRGTDPDVGAEKITGENCVPPCRCCCKNRKRPNLPNYCKSNPCCKDYSPCCSDVPSLCCMTPKYREQITDTCCCYCNQNPCCCDTITASGSGVRFSCSEAGTQSQVHRRRCRGGGGVEGITMSNDSDYAAEKDCSVRVAVRIRPQNPREVIDMCRICTTVTPGEPHVILGQDKAFTFDYVFDINCLQCDIYTTCVERLVDGALHGYNATVLAYGQTGSGKTFTMGTGFDHDLNEAHQGIIPRAVRHIFAGIEEMQQREYDDTGTQINTTQFSVGAQFMELYNEEIFDLLDPYNKGRGGGFKIHEDCTGQISVSGATISPVNGPQDALRCLQQGALARTTAATQMNDQSSRSHALFTILIRRQRMLTPDESGCPDGDLETLTSKFHFVDLAGSERLKRTGATGERAREGISINCGLLALGNCISALGDKAKRATHVPYRDSKLTRLLQDSLGGNSQTLMIACVSPCDRDFMETLNTLKYANRARNIKNKVQLNQDQSSRTIAQLRREIAALQMELLEYKQGKRLLDDEGNSCLSDTFHENSMLLADNKRLQQRLKAMQETINVLTDNNTALKVEKETSGWSTSLDSDRSVTNMVAGYLSEIEKLQAKLIESEEMYQQVKKNPSGGSSQRAAAKYTGLENPEDLINKAKRELEKDRELLMSRSLPGLQEDTNNSNTMETTATNNESFESDSDTESDDKANEMQADLIDINTDIEIKTKLIEQLELSQQRMQLMRQHYEDKLSLLNSKIINTQKERDEVLANLGPTPSNQPNDKVKKVKEEYERKINDMQREMKKLQQAQREHLRQQRELQAQEVKLRNLRTELTELKCIKTRLIRKMTEQTNRHKEEETRKAREIAQLRKEQRRQQNAVKSLQAQVHAKDQILKRKTEEVTALRRSKRDKLSQKASGRVPSKNRDNEIAAYNSRQARLRWDNLYRAITRASRNKQAVMQLEKELERLMNEREVLCRDLSAVQKRQRNSTTKNIDLANEEDTIKSNLNYVQDNIAHVQQAIMEFEEGKDTSSNDTQNLQLLIQNVNNMDEAKFLLEHLTNSAIMFQCDSALTQNRLTEHESLLKELQQESGIQQQLLQHFLSQNNSIQISDLFASLHLDGSNGIEGGGEKLNSNNLSGSQKSLNSNGTYDIPCESGHNMSSSYVVQRRSISRSPSPTPTIDLPHDKNAKIRRRTAQPQDLLFGEVSHNGDDAMTRSYTQQETTQRNFHPLMRVPSAPGSLKQSLNSPSLTKKKIETAMASMQPPQSPRLTRRGMPNKGSPGLDDDVTFAPQSPPVYRKMISREENSNGSTDVFSRLGAGTQDPAPGGSIHKVTGKIRVGVPLYCTHTVSGHNNSVLSIKVDDDDILYTAAADRTVKVWDLSREVAQHCLSTHPGPVIAVQNDKATRLLFSASGPYVRVWDLRTSNTKPIKTLTSSGQILAGNANITGVAPGESPITALCMGTSGNLYVAASDKVRIWDLKSITCVGKLSGGHQAAVMCVTAWEGDGGDSDGRTDFVATGSKDHYVKVFEVPKSGGVVYPLLNLEPPHYDGVQALAVAPDAMGADAELFSGSRDSGIKRWDLKSGELKQSLNNAHKGWVSGMAISGDVLLSSCRGGIVRLWNVRTCESLAELKTDLMINDIVASGQRVFTASSDGKVRMWRFTNTLRRQCSLDNNS